MIYIWQDRRQVEIRDRSDGGAGSWRVRTAGSGHDIDVDVLGCSIDLDALYVDAGAVAPA